MQRQTIDRVFVSVLDAMLKPLLRKTNLTLARFWMLPGPSHAFLGERQIPSQYKTLLAPNVYANRRALQLHKRINSVVLLIRVRDEKLIRSPLDCFRIHDLKLEVYRAVWLIE